MVWSSLVKSSLLAADELSEVGLDSDPEDEEAAGFAGMGLVRRRMCLPDLLPPPAGGDGSLTSCLRGDGSDLVLLSLLFVC